MDNVSRLLGEVASFNDVTARRTAGGIILNLSHRTTSDNAVSIYVPEENITFWNDHDGADDLDASLSDWERTVTNNQDFNRDPGI